MTNPGPAVPAAPTPIRVLWPLMIVRTVLATATLVSGLTVLPGIVDRSSRGLVDQRTGAVIDPLDPGLKSVLVVVGVVGAVVGAAFVAAWLWAGRRAVEGVRWAAVGVGVLSGLGVAGVVFAAVVSAALEQAPDLTYAYDYPTWLLVVSGVQAVADLLVVVLLVLPASRAWIRALNPPRTGPPPPGGWPADTAGRRH